MSHAKKTLRILSAAVLLVGLSACPEKEALQIGVILPLTGSASMYGNSVRKGVELAFDQIQNDSELTYEIAIKILDSGSDPDKAAQLGEELFGESLAVLGGVTSSEALAILESAKESGKVYLSPTASTAKLSRAARAGFRLFTTTIQEATVMATFVDDTLNSETVTILRQPGEPGDGFTEGFTTAFETAGGAIDAVIDISSESDITAAAAAIAEAGPDAVYIAAEGNLIPTAIKALRAVGFGRSADRQQWILSTSSLSHPQLIEAAGGDAEDVYITQSVFDLANEQGAMPGFVAAYRAKYEEDPDLYAGHGYDSLLLLAEATKMIINTLPTEYLKGIHSIDPLAGSTGMALQFNESGDAQKFPRIHWIEGGVPQDFQVAMAKKRAELQEQMEKIKRDTERLRLQGVTE